MNNDYKFFNFINDIGNNNNILIKEIEILIKKISVIEQICKENQDSLVENILPKSEEDTSNNNMKDTRNINTNIVEIENTHLKNDSDSNYTENNTGEDLNNKTTSESIEDKQKSIYDKTVKRLYKILALKYHPDKNKGSVNKYFKIANNAHKNNNLGELVYILSISNIDIEMDSEEIDILNIEKEKLDSQFNSLKNSILYKWRDITDSDKKLYIDYLKKINGIN